MKKVKTLFMALSLAAAGALLFSCNKFYDEFLKNKLNSDDFFDFVSLRNVDLDLEYGSLASNVLASVYAYDPMVNEYSGDVSTKGEPFYRGFFDEDGNLTGKMIAPKYADTVYVYTNAWGVPTCMPVAVKDGVVKCAAPTVSYADETTTKATVSASLRQVDNQYTNSYSYFTWSSTYGKISDPANLVSTGSFTSTTIEQIKKTLWDGKSSKPSKLDNSSLVRSTDHVNTVIAKAYQDAGGAIHTVENAHIWLTFVTETGSYQSTFGYYYYKSDEDVSKKPSSLKTFVLLPNASVSGNSPYNQLSTIYNAYNAPVSANTKIQLLYQGEDGKLTTDFPAGYTIGYFLIPDGYVIKESGYWWDKKYEGSIDFARAMVYSNCEWNSDGKSRFISMAMSDGTLVYGIEDGADLTYDDVIFSINADPIDAIQDPDKPVVDPDSGKVVDGEQNTYYTYAFEDLWPVAGDYDMNDVVIEHKSTVSFDSKNIVKKVVDVYTVVNRKESAELHDAFGVIYNPFQRGNSIVIDPQTDETVDETSTGAIIFFRDAQENIGKSFTVTRTFSDGNLLKDNLDMDVDPFIIVSQVDSPEEEVASDGRPYYTQKNRFEVHMPKKEGTSLISYSLYGQSSDAYFVNRDGKHPFGVTIPMSGFTKVSEWVAIEDEYYYFNSWAESFGETDNDWYLYYKKYKE